MSRLRLEWEAAYSVAVISIWWRVRMRKFKVDRGSRACLEKGCSNQSCFSAVLC